MAETSVGVNDYSEINGSIHFNLRSSTGCIELKTLVGINTKTVGGTVGQDAKIKILGGFFLRKKKLHKKAQHPAKCDH